jgi:predicted nuclease with TOPRIM domain
MRTQLETRLAQLKVEYEAGQKMLTELEQKQQHLRDTLLRISGAILVLEEELDRGDDEPNDGQPTETGTNGAERAQA